MGQHRRPTRQLLRLRLHCPPQRHDHRLHGRPPRGLRRRTARPPHPPQYRRRTDLDPNPSSGALGRRPELGQPRLRRRQDHRRGVPLLQPLRAATGEHQLLVRHRHRLLPLQHRQRRHVERTPEPGRSVRPLPLQLGHARPGTGARHPARVRPPTAHRRAPHHHHGSSRGRPEVRRLHHLQRRPRPHLEVRRRGTAGSEPPPRR